MARESFENQEVADILNKYFIAIKVDREERPDIDSIYMSACQALTGSGGWPLSVFINDYKEPFYAGTYFPKDVFINLLKKIAKLWETNPSLLYENAKMVTKFLENDKPKYLQMNENIIDKTFDFLVKSFDEKYGGFGKVPKFPSPNNLLFLLKYYEVKKESKAINMVIKTLDAMRAGGIYDHIEFGFCRYSTDEKWLVPHFEKMLYDNILLLIVYLMTYNVTKFNRYKRTSEELISFLVTNMEHEEGAFFTAIDADSEGEEGKYYTFTYDELLKILGDGLDKIGATKEGNFENKNIINTIGKSEFLDEDVRLKLLELRKEKVRPLRDDKILTSYNGLAIAAFSLAGKYLDEKYLGIAKNIYNFIINRLLKDGRLFASFKDGTSKVMGFAEDYAYFIYGILELYYATFDDKYFNIAKLLNQTFINHFYDYDEGGFFITADDAETILFRKKEIYDGATPSSNAIAVNNLLRLSIVNDELKEMAMKTINSFGKEIEEYPYGYTFSILNILMKDNLIEISLEGKNLKPMLDIIKNANLPFYTITISEGKENHVAYVCKDKTCLPPITDLDELRFTLSNA